MFLFCLSSTEGVFSVCLFLPSYPSYPSTCIPSTIQKGYRHTLTHLRSHTTFSAVLSRTRRTRAPSLTVLEVQLTVQLPVCHLTCGKKLGEIVVLSRVLSFLFCQQPVREQEVLS